MPVPVLRSVTEMFSQRRSVEEKGDVDVITSSSSSTCLSDNTELCSEFSTYLDEAQEGGELWSESSPLSNTRAVMKKVFPGGGCYEGEMLDGVRHGQGVFYFPNGDKYTGQWVGDVKQGYGVAVFHSGERYEGEWQNGKKHGQGHFSFRDGNTFDGEWKEDAKNGFGIARFVSGNVYQGQWRSDCMTGEGKFSYVNGDCYEGQWQLNKKHGFGKFTSRSEEDSYEGEWYEDERHGSGILVRDGSEHCVVYRRNRVMSVDGEATRFALQCQTPPIQAPPQPQPTRASTERALTELLRPGSCGQQAMKVESSEGSVITIMCA